MRRAQILDAALNRFGRDGYRRTSLARVAEDAGITDAGLLHHFRDKQQLLLAVVEYWFQRQDERWMQVSASMRRQGGLPQLPAGHRGQSARARDD